MSNYAPKAEMDEPYKQEILQIIQKKINEHPRSHQVQVGPSEIGGCERKLTWKLAYGGDGDRPGGWASLKGTIMHSWLDEVFKGTDRLMPDGTERFMSDTKLTAVSPSINGGTIDLYDRLYQRVVDWKVPGDGTMDKARANNLARGYYVQANTYGYHLEAMGFPVSTVALFFLPQCGDELHKKAVLRVWKYDATVAKAAIANVDRLQAMLTVASPRKVMEVATTLSDFCQSCPAFTGNGDRRAMCPGASPGNRSVNIDANPFGR